MPLEIRQRLKSYYIFILAASAAPLSLLAAGPCASGACAACPGGGACFLAFPLIIFGVLFAKAGRRIGKALGLSR
ncbi:MAG: hypothetical protein WCK39_08850 [Methanomassiliicoccales archaeon]